MYILRLTDGTTTVTLTGDDPIVGVTYFPSVGDDGALTVGETAIVFCEGTESAIRLKLNAVTRLLSDASQREDLLTPRVYLEKQETSASTLYRSEVKRGSVHWSDSPTKHRLNSVLSSIEVAVILERLDFWEGSNEVEIALSSSSQSARTGGVDVYNASNASANNNTVGIAASQILGDLPSPLRLRILNNDGTTIAMHTFFIANNVFNAPGSIDNWILGSESTAGATQSWVGAVDGNSLTWIFPLSATLLSQTKGRYLRIIPVFSTIPSGANWKAGVYSDLSGAYIPLRSTREVYNEFGIKMFDLGALPFPPGGYGNSLSAMSLVITVRTPLSGTATINFIQLMASESFRRIDQIGYNDTVLMGVEDDGISGTTYGITGSVKYPIAKGFFDPIKVWPGKQQELSILFNEGAPFTVGRKMKVSAWYRPRVRSL